MSTDKDYTPPKVWKWKKRKDDPFGGTNRPISGATHDTRLPRGKHPFQLHSLGSPNGQKVKVGGSKSSFQVKICRQMLAFPQASVAV